MPPPGLRPFRAELIHEDQFQVTLHPFGGPEAVLTHLSRYTHRIAISNSRLISADADTVAWRSKEYRIKHGDLLPGRVLWNAMSLEGMKVMRLATDEFIRRFLIHVLPGGFHRIRHYGFLVGGGRKEKVALIPALLG